MTNSQIEYEWPNKYATADKKQLEALGVISLNFNLYEHSLVIFFEEKFYKDVAGFLFLKLSNEERAALIRLLMKDDPQLANEIGYLLRHFSICAENRHNLLHSRLIMPLPDILAVEKFARKSQDTILEFQLKLGDLRRAADEMYAGVSFVLDLWNFLRKREQYQMQLALSQDSSISPPPLSELPSLPKRPPEPRKINPHQSVEVG